MASPKDISFETWTAPATEAFRFWISFFPTAPLFGVDWRYGEMMGGFDQPAATPAKDSAKVPVKPVAKTTPAAKTKPEAAPKPKPAAKAKATAKPADAKASVSKPKPETAPAAKTAPKPAKEAVTPAKTEVAAAPAPAPKVAAKAAAPAPEPVAAPKPAAPVETAPAVAKSAKVDPVKPVAEKDASAKPAAAKKAPAKPVDPSAAPDDLKLIKGVGPGLEKQLNGLGIYQFAQIAKMSDKDLQSVDDRLTSFKGRCFRDDWVGQAKTLLG